ncbi:hypothetical protein PM035_15600 [Halorubrum ezzemoulense]|uniref:hypothetical protein n=1 Tax=Halorubrum ezzemoulense TaxID=337243 RepID=UPI00232C5B30|nr:hypothetical protein [Halorubrum ezzemoulense]MDB2269092.1 hypothetical protein [Halorubrum ezzemoulense]
MGREPASHLDPVKDAIGRSEFAEAGRVGLVRAVDPERGGVPTEYSVEQECLDGRDTEVVVDVDERDARRELREIGGRSLGMGLHGSVDGEIRKRGEPWMGGESGSDDGVGGVAPRPRVRAIDTVEMTATSYYSVDRLTAMPARNKSRSRTKLLISAYWLMDTKAPRDQFWVLFIIRLLFIPIINNFHRSAVNLCTNFVCHLN